MKPLPTVVRLAPPDVVRLGVLGLRTRPVRAVANTHATISRSDRDVTEDVTGIAVLASKLNLLTAINATVQSGQFLGPATAGFPTVVLGSVAASRPGFADLPANRPAPRVYVDDRWFTVIGILDPTPHPPDIDRAALVGWPGGAAADHQPGRPVAGRGDPPVRRPRGQTRDPEHVLGAVPRAGRGGPAGRRHRGGQHHGRVGARTAARDRAAPGPGRQPGPDPGAVLTESVILALLGGVLGVILGAWPRRGGWPGR